MTNENNKEKTFDAVKYMRQQPEILTEKLSTMTREEIIEYFKRIKAENAIKPRA